MERAPLLVLLLLAACPPSPVVVPPVSFDAVALPVELRDAKRILWVGAHPDDEAVVAPLLGALCVGGDAGCTLLVLTRGEGGNCGLAGGCSPDLATVRTREMERSVALFDAGLVLWDLGNEAATTPEEAAANFSRHAGGDEALLQRIEGELSRVSPDVVLLFDPRNGVTCHPDHRAAAGVTLLALNRLPALTPRVYLVASRYDGEGFDGTPASLDRTPWLGYAPRASDPAIIPINTSSTWSFEGAVLRAHESQFDTRRVAQFEGAPSRAQLVPLLRLTDAHEGDARYEGCQ